MEELTSLQLFFVWFAFYWMVSVPFKMFLVFLWAPEQFVLGERYHSSYSALMTWVDLVCAFIMVPVIPEIYYVYMVLFKRNK